MPRELLTTAQARQLTEQVGPPLRWTIRLVRRMEEVGFLPNDPLLAAAMRAHDALQALHMAARYASCESGVGRPQEE